MSSTGDSRLGFDVRGVLTEVVGGTLVVGCVALASFLFASPALTWVIAVSVAVAILITAFVLRRQRAAPQQVSPTAPVSLPPPNGAAHSSELGSRVRAALAEVLTDSDQSALQVLQAGRLGGLPSELVDDLPAFEIHCSVTVTRTTSVLSGDCRMVLATIPSEHPRNVAQASLDYVGLVMPSRSHLWPELVRADAADSVRLLLVEQMIKSEALRDVLTNKNKRAEARVAARRRFAPSVASKAREIQVALSASRNFTNPDLRHIWLVEVRNWMGESGHEPFNAHLVKQLSSQRGGPI